MRIFLLGFFALFLFASSGVQAQDMKAIDKAAKKASKQLASFSVSGDEMKLQEAVDAIGTVLAMPGADMNFEANLAAGDIHSQVITQYVNSRVLGTEGVQPMVDNPAIKAAGYYTKAFEIAKAEDDGSDMKDAIKGLSTLHGNITNEGIYAIQDGDYEHSFMAFNTAVKADMLLTANDGTSSYADEAKRQDDKYYAALSAIQIENLDAAEPLVMSLYENDYDDANLYDALYKISMAKGDKEAAAKYLAEGRTAFPDALPLLFTEINFYLAEGRLPELTEKLKTAIEKEPDNVSLYATAGSVYERLHNLEKEEGNDAKASEYFDAAKKNYEMGLTKDPSNASLIYSTGALYYNRAAAMTQTLIKLGDDYSKEGQKKYEDLKAKVDAEFALALPYFQKAEMADPNDANTVIALKEMYARMDEFEISNEFKTRYETIAGGGEVKGSYFKEKGM